MPLPATRFTLRHVGSSRGDRPRTAARTHAPAGSGFRSGLPRRWAPAGNVLRYVQCPDVPSFSGKTSASAPTGMQDGGDRGQRALASRESNLSLAVSTSACSAVGFLAPLQSRSESGRTGMETDPTIVYTQQVFQNAARPDRGRAGTVHKVVSAQPHNCTDYAQLFKTSCREPRNTRKLRPVFCAFV